MSRLLNTQHTEIVIFFNHDILQVVRSWLLTIELQLQFWVSAIRSGTETSFSSNSFVLPLLVPFHTRLSPSSQVFDGPDQARQYFILDI